MQEQRKLQRNLGIRFGNGKHNFPPVTFCLEGPFHVDDARDLCSLPGLLIRTDCISVESVDGRAIHALLWNRENWR